MGPFRPLGFVLFAILIALLLWVLSAGRAHAKTVAIAEQQGIVVTLTDERCAVAEVSNLPFRATWREGDKLFEGCWGANSGVIASDWREDRSVAVMPAQVFHRPTEI